MDKLRPHGAHCDTTVRFHQPLILETPGAYNEVTQTADVNVRQITQTINVVDTKMSLSPLTQCRACFQYPEARGIERFEFYFFTSTLFFNATLFTASVLQVIEHLLCDYSALGRRKGICQESIFKISEAERFEFKFFSYTLP